MPNAMRYTMGTEGEAPHHLRAMSFTQAQIQIAAAVLADKTLKSDRRRIQEMIKQGIPATADFVALVFAVHKAA